MSDFLDLDINLKLGNFQLDASLTADKSPLAIIGPSGSGKTLILSSIAGIRDPDNGRIVVGDRLLFDSGQRVDVPPQERHVGYVPQEYALFPHLTVEGNIGFGLRGSSQRRQARAREMLDLVGLADERRKHPHSLSGGQRQRVALARALAPEPDLLLLDEPFSALDGPTREALLTDVQRLIAVTSTPTVIVTHDRNEALRLAQSVAVLMEGVVRQTGTPASVFSSPADDAVASFVGVETVVPGHVREVVDGVALVQVGACLVEGGSAAATGSDVLVCLRPEDVGLSRPDGESPSTSARNRLAARVTRIGAAGPFTRVEVDAGFRLVALITKHSLEDLALKPGSEVVATFKATAVHLIARSPDHVPA